MHVYFVGECVNTGAGAGAGVSVGANTSVGAGIFVGVSSIYNVYVQVQV